MTLSLRLLGGVLLVCCGVGAGYLLADQARKKWAVAHAFSRLLEYLRSAISYQPFTGAELIAQAAECPEFAVLDLTRCERFDQLSPPQSYSAGLRRELAADLAAVESLPRKASCAVLSRMIARCRAEEHLLQEASRGSARLLPRLGGCAGAMAAILFL